MTARTLESPPRLLPLFARSAASMVPGASLLPFVPGRGREVPELELRLEDVRCEPDRVAAYAKVCGFPLRAHLPITYPHVLAFPLHMAVMADGSFPFGAVGLVHVENRIVQHASIPIGEALSIVVRPSALSAHRRGRTFALVTEVSVGGQVVWEGHSTMLRRGGGGDVPAGAAPTDTPDGDGIQVGATWRLPGDLGRRYAAVSGDSNPIHMHPLSAKLFGFPGAIAHGMWSKARCLAALESRMPDACEASVRFRKPIVLPARVDFASSAPSQGAEATGTASRQGAQGQGVAEQAGRVGERIEFALTNSKKGITHLDGVVSPVDDNEERSTAR